MSHCFVYFIDDKLVLWQKKKVYALSRFLIASVINCNKLSGLRQNKLLFYICGGQKVKINSTRLKLWLGQGYHSTWRLHRTICFFAFFSINHVYISLPRDVFFPSTFKVSSTQNLPISLSSSITLTALFFNQSVSLGCDSPACHFWDLWLHCT